MVSSLLKNLHSFAYGDQVSFSQVKSQSSVSNKVSSMLDLAADRTVPVEKRTVVRVTWLIRPHSSCINNDVCVFIVLYWKPYQYFAN